MKPFLWTSYGESEVTEKIKYWVDLWEEVIEDFSKTIYDRELINPHLLLINLLDEIKFNGLERPGNNKYFLNKLNFYIDNDEVVKELFNTDFVLLRNELSQASRRHEYFILLCEQIMKSFQDGTYFKESCKLLSKIILNPKWEDSDEEDILLISQNLIIELILVGYSIETIITIPRSLFDKYKIIGNNGDFIQTEYPASVDKKDYYENGVFNLISYNEALKAEIDSLSISDRVNRLNYYFDKEPSEVYGIFHIEGLKGDIDDYVGEVNFYSPKLEAYWTDRSDSDIKYKNFDEMKLKFYDEEIPYSVKHDKKLTYGEFASRIKQAPFANAAVRIKYRDYKSAKRQAIEIIEKSLDILRLYICSEIPFRVKLDNFYLVDCEDLSEISNYSSEETPLYKKAMCFDLKMWNFFEEKKDILKGFKELLFNGDIEKYPLTSKLMYSLHWYRKAFESNRPEDKLLNYWIAIENLFTFDSKNGNLVLRNKEEKHKFNLVEEIIPYIELSCSIKNVANDTHYYLQERVISSHANDTSNLNGRLLKVPNETLKICQLEFEASPKKINLVEFVQTLHLLDKYVTRKSIEKRIEYTHKFYNDRKFTSSELDRKLKQTKQDLLLIYRYRNLIVHNAHFDNKILPYYVVKAENFAGNLIRKVLYEHVKDRTKSQQEILLWERIKVERAIEKLKTMPVDIWELQTNY